MNQYFCYLLLLFPFWFLFSCEFYKKHLPKGAPGLGIEKENSKYKIYFDVGIFTLSDFNITREEIESLLQTSILEIQKEYDFLLLMPIVDQPLDAIFFIQKSTKKKRNPLIQIQKLNSDWESVNPLIVKNKFSQKKYFIMSELENFFYNQVRYDLVILPLPVVNNVNLNNENSIKEKQFFISYGRNSLDKISFSISLDYQNLKQRESSKTLKEVVLSYIFYLQPNLVKELPQNTNYQNIRKQIFDFYYKYNKGEKIQCQEIKAIQEKLDNDPIFVKNSEYFRLSLNLNLNFLYEKCI